MANADWYYIGHYGQLGPLTREQIDELIEGAVIERSTFVWKQGMSDWLSAGQVVELRDSFQKVPAVSSPPPPPTPLPMPPSPRPPTPPMMAPMSMAGAGLASDTYPQTFGSHHPTYLTATSDRSRLVAGLLQFIPGIGRIYLGYAAHGVLQLVLTPCLGLGWIWSVIDGVLILAGGVKLDGYGRRLPD